MVCARHLCTDCAGGPQRSVCALVKCDTCLAKTAGEDDLIHSVSQHMSRLDLQRQTSEVMSYHRRTGTLAVHRRAHQTLAQYGQVYGALTLPTSVLQLAHWVTWMLRLRDPTLDSSTAELYAGVGSQRPQETAAWC